MTLHKFTVTTAFMTSKEKGALHFPFLSCSLYKKRAMHREDLLMPLFAPISSGARTVTSSEQFSSESAPRFSYSFRPPPPFRIHPEWKSFFSTRRRSRCQLRRCYYQRAAEVFCGCRFGRFYPSR